MYKQSKHHYFTNSHKKEMNKVQMKIFDEILFIIYSFNKYKVSLKVSMVRLAKKCIAIG